MSPAEWAQAAEAVGRPTLFALVILAILRTKAGSAIAARLANGQHKNGAARNELAGQASIDFWKLTFRELLEHEIKPRHDETRAALREILLRLEALK